MKELLWFAGGIVLTILFILFKMGGNSIRGMFAWIIVILAPKRWWG